MTVRSGLNHYNYGHEANLTRFHGVFAPNSKHRALVTQAKRGKGMRSRTYLQNFLIRSISTAGWDAAVKYGYTMQVYGIKLD